MNEFMNKMTSGRYFATVAIISTYCLVVLGSLYLVIKGKLEVQAFLGMIVGFGQLAQFICQAYFGREDRNPENGGNGNGKENPVKPVVVP